MLLSIGMLMLSATQIYTILTVQLFAFLNLLPVEADILAYNFENVTQTFDDLPARFGYRLPTEGLKGFLINSKPENACEPIAPPPLEDNFSRAFIVLIRRLDCNFDVKVLNAQRAGYKAAIVHNVDSDDLISMGSNDIEVLKKIDIPSVFIGETSANSLKYEFTYEKGGHIMLIPEFSLPLEYYLIPFLIIVGICLILIVIFMITKFVQDRHRARRNRLRKDQLKKLPVHKFKKEFMSFADFFASLQKMTGKQREATRVVTRPSQQYGCIVSGAWSSCQRGDEYDICAICLDEYEDGDKLRILPCSHAYHCKCVDPWLTKTKKTCPVCKQKVVPSQGDSDSETDSSQEENDVSENTPLLRPLASVSTQSFGALSESHSHQNMTESSEYEEDDNEDIDSSDAEDGMNEESVVVQLQPNDEREHREANTV
ncbi:E3 ubiquitin-protein ligase RNF13 isoform X1 [Chelonia mydas]|uniref:E3 ubiquitin-protein ligase RNF13 isoform X1 n=1 Tax=Chelonia mydas TaxID=8469 RepID=UPI0018A1F27A|nr:E3 ubiquitin-protein ligase RNF13 isoform X1 [Chelonia mydas]XP_037764196.1 E3 ubiquitin-protein ligase RNF13 isoform X1 [Chelonia mydas]XP_037764197.1 E3 ubiquitin-protein ligase RNF13 isoform X1 [Chelonia mydas]XP_037764198.1 E3 ubiquitin-protein ligase RNF13 isoform X1 [Chelonia mydas]XP_037764199.1 E3 ubiquitin-protein ligase RNF13 isoform X1 [Chelonia mydas]